MENAKKQGLQKKVYDKPQVVYSDEQQPIIDLFNAQFSAMKAKTKHEIVRTIVSGPAGCGKSTIIQTISS